VFVRVYKASIILPVFKKGDKRDCSTYTFVKIVQIFIHHSVVKVNSIYRGNYWGISVWIKTQQAIY